MSEPTTKLKCSVDGCENKPFECYPPGHSDTEEIEVLLLCDQHATEQGYCEGCGQKIDHDDEYFPCCRDCGYDEFEDVDDIDDWEDEYPERSWRGSV